MKRIEELPQYIGRKAIERYFPGVISRRYLANLASIGKGPRYLKVGRKVVYRTEDFVAWLETEGTEISTIDQRRDRLLPPARPPRSSPRRARDAAGAAPRLVRVDGKPACEKSAGGGGEGRP